MPAGGGNNRYRDDMDISFLDDIPESTEVQQVPPTVELGVTGIKRAGGYVDEEFLPALRGRKAIQVFKEMSENDSMVGAMLFTIDKLIREVEWKVSPPDQTPESQQAAEFVETCMEDMSHSWDDFVGEALSCLTYGWSWHEIVYKKRTGPYEKDGSKKSKYTDGLIGWRKMPIRSQETMLRWVFDENGGIKALVQLAPPHYKTAVIPIEKSLLFRTNVSKGNPEGRSLLRNAYRSWYFKKRLEEFEAIGVERDLAGMPVAKVPAEFLMAPPGSKQEKMVQSFKRMVRGVRRDENEGLVLPLQYDQETKQPLYDFELMSSAGARQFDTTTIIQRYEQRILMAVLADWILVGHEQTGSYSLHTDKTGVFRAALNAIVTTIADTLNRHAIPRLFELNAWKLDELPKIEPSDIDPPDLNELASFITSTAGAGMQWFPDPELEKFIRDIARLPEMTDETMEFKRELQMQDQAMQFADSQMNLIGLKQKAEMTAQGMTPEQAEIESQTPTPDQQQRMQPPPEQDSPAAQAQHGRDKEKMMLQDRMAGKQHTREKEKLSLQEKIAGKGHTREKEKTSLQDKVGAAQHKRTVEQMREKVKTARQMPKPTSGKTPAKKPPTKKGKGPR